MITQKCSKISFCHRPSHLIIGKHTLTQCIVKALEFNRLDVVDKIGHLLSGGHFI